MLSNIMKSIINMKILINGLAHELESHKCAENFFYVMTSKGMFFY